MSISIKSGRPIPEQAREIVYNVATYLRKMKKVFKLQYNVNESVSDATGVSVSTVKKVLREADASLETNKLLSFSTPQKRKLPSTETIEDETPIEDNIDEEDGSPSVLNPTVGVLISRQNELLEKACSYLEKSSKTDKAANNHIAQAWSEKLLLLEPQQRAFAEKAINDVLFEASQGTLSRHSVKINED